MIEMNQYKYASVHLADEHMANLTAGDLAEAIRTYRERQIEAQEEADQREESSDSGQSRRSVFDRLGKSKGKTTQKAQSKDKQDDDAKQKKLAEVRERIRKEEEEKLELKIQKRMQQEEERLAGKSRSKRTRK